MDFLKLSNNLRICVSCLVNWAPRGNSSISILSVSEEGPVKGSITIGVLALYYIVISFSACSCCFYENLAVPLLGLGM